MWTAILTIINVLAALATISIMIRVHLTEFKRHNDVEEVKGQIASLRGKVTSQERWDEVKIREAVDRYLEESGQRASGGGELESMMQLMGMMGGGMMGGGMPQQPQQPPDPQPRQRPGLVGKGGGVVSNGTES